MAEIRKDWVTLEVGDGATMRTYVAGPQDGRPRAGLLVFQEAFGVNAHIRDVTERFAREGYQALAPELFHRTAPGFEVAYNNFEAVMPHVRTTGNHAVSAVVSLGSRALPWGLSRRLASQNPTRRARSEATSAP